MPSLTLALSCLLMAYSASAEDLTAVADRLGQISTFFEALNATGVIDELHAEGPYSIFAPNDEASQNYTWPTNQTEMTDLIRYHVVKGNFSTDLLNGTMEALDGSVIVSEPIDIDNERIIAVNDAYIVKGDHYFDNGVLHIVSKVLDPTYQNENNQSADDDQGNAQPDDDGQDQQQQQQPQQPPYNGNNEAARPPYMPRGYGAAPYQAQSPTGFGGNNGLGMNGFGTNNGLGSGMNGNNGALGSGLGRNNGAQAGGLNGNNAQLAGGIGLNGNNDDNRGLGGLLNGNNGRYDGNSGLGEGFPQSGGSNPQFRGSNPQFGADNDGQQYGQGPENSLIPSQNDENSYGDDQEPMSQGLPQGDSDPIVSRGNQDDNDQPATGLDSWGQQQPQRPRSFLDDGGFNGGLGRQSPAVQGAGMLGPFGQPQQRSIGGSMLQSPIFGDRILPQRQTQYQQYPQRTLYQPI